MQRKLSKHELVTSSLSIHEYRFVAQEVKLMFLAAAKYRQRCDLLPAVLRSSPTVIRIS